MKNQFADDRRFRRYFPIMKIKSDNTSLIESTAGDTETAAPDLAEILPRFLDDDERSLADQQLSFVERAVEFGGERFRLFIMPTGIAAEFDEYGFPVRHVYCFPGSQEALVETALVELAARADTDAFDGEKRFVFRLNQLHTHLAARNLPLSHAQIERSLAMLAGAAYRLVDKDSEWIFRSIETLASTGADDDTRYLAYLGQLIVERIRKTREKVPRIDLL